MEVIVAFTILLIVLVPVASVLVNSIGQAATARQRLTALSLAEQYLELLNNTPFGPSGANRTPTITALPKMGSELLQKAHTVRSSVSYTIYAEFHWASGEGTPDLCTSGSTPKDIDVQVLVRWSHTTQHVTDTTVINYPPAGLETYGFLAVQVDGDPASGPPADAGGHAWTTRVRSVPVTLTGTTPPSVKQVYPDSYGCAFQAVAPGSYKVSLADPSPGTPAGDAFGQPTTPSWVANANERTATTHSSVTVSAGQVAATTFQYDEGSLITLHYPSTTATDGLVACPAAGSIECLVTGQAPATAARPASTPVAELSVRTSTGWTVDRPGLARVAATACAADLRCLAVGYALNPTGAAYAASVSSSTSGTPNFVHDSGPAGVSSFDSATCPSSSACYAVGTATSGPVLLSAAVTATGVSWKADALTLPAGTTLKAVSGLSCPATGTCYATTTTSSGPAILSLGAATAWVTDKLPATPAVTSLPTVDCPASGTCYAVADVAGGAEVLSLSTTGTTVGTTWMVDTSPAGVTVTALTAEACPSATECYAIGTVRSGTTTSHAILSLTPPTTWSVDTAPATAALSSLTCPTSGTCVVLGSTTSAPALLVRTGPTTFQPGTFALSAGTTLDSISSVGCSPGGHCDAVGTATKAGTTGAVILSLTGTTWTEDSVPAGPVYLTGVACGTSVCAAPGASETSAVYLVGSTTGTGWTASSPSGTGGLYVADAPIAVSDPNLLTSNPLVVGVPATSAKDLTQVGPLFPFEAGYSVGAASCAAELSAASAAVTSVPGGTAAATLALGLLPIEVVDAAGTPVSGATLSAAVTDAACTALAPISGGSVPASYTLETTGPLGLSAIAMIYDTYKVTVRAPDGHTASVVVRVTPTASVVGGVSQPLPSPVVVTVT